ncbi:unnamed protein product [Phytophthora lilii]|uniref:Unnamed protein product n=1 Tax=Phytophthora lilii TaxID=2077276 RepID=A0A9W6WRD2_9STRA|nr:unnamed protein product [Phytophthora lilii]
MLAPKEVFGTSAASPYFMDSHMVNPKKSRASRRSTDGDDDDDDNDDIGGVDDPCDDLAAQIRRTDRSLQQLKKFIYEMEGTNTPQDRWCEAFQLCMEDGAGHWARQLPNKTQHICDYLLRLNGYAGAASIHYEFGGRTGEQHVKHFLETCRDDTLVEQLIPQRFDNIAKVDAVINDKLVADRRRKGLGRSSSKPSRDGSRRNDAGRRDDRRGDREDRRGDGRSRRDDRYSRQVTLVDASVDELYEAWSDKMAIT